MPLTLYHNDMSVCAQNVRLCLAGKALAYEDEHLNLRAGGQKRPEAGGREGSSAHACAGPTRMRSLNGSIPNICR